MNSILYLLRLLFLLLCVRKALSENHYDYIIVGGGTSGLALANRLSADQSIKVAVLEAGPSVLDDPNVQDPEVFFQGGNPSLHWNYTSKPQRHLGDRTLNCTAAKALGGTSTINGMTYLRAQKSQLDNWESLGNPGWNWKSVLPYYKRSENLTIPPIQEDFEPKFHGFKGPLKVGWPSEMARGLATSFINETWNALGLPYNEDANGGAMRGFSVWPWTVDSDTSTRQDAARAYYLPISDRSNIDVFLESTAAKIAWSEEAEGNLTNLRARGVEAITKQGESFQLRGNEILVCLSAMRTPGFLEHSGIGDPRVLNQFNISVQVNLPGVGHGLVDHPNNGISAAFRDPNNTFSGLPPFVAYPTAFDVFGIDTKSVAKRLRRAVPEYAAQVVSGAGDITSVQAQERILNLALDMIFDHPDTTPLGEIFVYPNFAWPSGEPGTAMLSVWPSQPFSRGSIHISSRDPLDYPAIDYNFHHVQADMVIQIGLMRYARRFFSTAPFSSFVGAETSPGLNAVPIDASDELWEEWIRSTAETTSHEVGTAAMRPKELGGVIDSHLRVYGTENVRVIDASIWPSHLSGHLSGTCYMVAEKAADIILAERNQ